MLTWINTPTPKSDRFLLLDRDGVLNSDREDSVKNWQEYQFFPEALESMNWLNRRGVNVILVSNQSGLARGVMGWEDFWTIHERMVRAIRDAGGELLAAFYCPHHPDEGCVCRKPAPGMIRAAHQLYGFPLETTYMIGDRVTDLLAAENAGCRGILLDRSSRDEEPAVLQASKPEAIQRFHTLSEAVQAIFREQPGP